MSKIAGISEAASELEHLIAELSESALLSSGGRHGQRGRVRPWAGG
jgi:hypothetical protein